MPEPRANRGVMGQGDFGWQRTIDGFARSLAPATLAFLYPDRCQICRRGRARADDGYVCTNCREGSGGVRFIRPPFCHRCGLPYPGEATMQFQCGNCAELDLQFSQARAAVVAQSLTLDIIHRYKYHRALWFEPFLAELLINAAAPALVGSGIDWLVPIPLHPLKRREREFNQAERLAARLGKAAGLCLNTKLLRRVENTATQTLLTRGERAENMRGAFAMRSADDLQGRRIVLIDDVLTTGATASACARVLRAAGANEVQVWTVARGV